MPATPHAPHALVTGGGRGIGRAVAATLARQGITVTVLGRKPKVLDEAVAAGDAHFADVADVASEPSISAAIARAAERQPIDILIANAGAAESAPFAKSDAARLPPGPPHGSIPPSRGHAAIASKRRCFARLRAPIERPLQAAAKRGWRSSRSVPLAA